MKLLLLEDHPVFRFGLRELLRQAFPEAECVEAETLAQARERLREQAMDLAITDLHLPDADGLAAVTRLLRLQPGLPLLVLSLNQELAYARQALQLGARGFLGKEQAAEELVAAVRRVRGGGRYIPARLAEHLADLASGHAQEAPHARLSPQELQVMLGLAAGERLTALAERMNLSPKTLSTYRARVLEKLGLQTNAELVRYCLDRGLAR